VTAVQCVDIVKTFRAGKVRAVDRVSFTAPSGAITAIVGPSGCGKTTLLRCIAGLDDPSAGTILIGGTDVTALPPRERGIGMVFQNAGLYPDKTVADNIAFPLKMSRVSRADRAERVREVAALVRLADHLDRYPKELSGGQRQRVGIARALVRRPSVVLMDEPLSSLDAALRTDMRRDLRELQQRLGLTMIFVTHDQTEAMTLGDQLVVCFDGEVAQAGSASEVFLSPDRADVARFLGAMNTLPAATVVRGMDGSVGFRPEDAVLGGTSVHSDDTTVTVHGRPEYSELHGSDALIAVALNDARIHVRVRATDLAQLVEQPALAVRVPRDRLHWFDEAGRRRGDEAAETAPERR